MNTRSPITAVKSSGFVCMIFLTMLLAVSSYSSYLCASIREAVYFYDNLDTFRHMNYVEVLVINRLKYEFLTYREKDEVFLFENCLVQISIDGSRAEIYLSENGLSRQRRMKYDSELNIMRNYY